MDRQTLISFADEFQKIAKNSQVFSAGGVDYEVKKLWELAKKLPTQRLAVEDAKDYLESKTWTGGKSPREVLDAQDDTHGHMSRIRKANLRYPVIKAPNEGMADGLHRLAKAHMQGKDTVPLKQFRSWEEMEPAKLAGWSIDDLEAPPPPDVRKHFAKFSSWQDIGGAPVSVPRRPAPFEKRAQIDAVCPSCGKERKVSGDPKSMTCPDCNESKLKKLVAYETKFQGIPIAVENPKNSYRRGKDADGKPWKTKMLAPYGFFPKTRGVDGDPVDVFVGPDKEAPTAFVVHQRRKDTGAYDEDKVMLGVRTKTEAKKLFLKHYDSPKFLGPISRVGVDRLREILRQRKMLKKIGA